MQQRQLLRTALTILCCGLVALVAADPILAQPSPAIKVRLTLPTSVKTNELIVLRGSVTSPKPITKVVLKVSRAQTYTAPVSNLTNIDLANLNLHFAVKSEGVHGVELEAHTASGQFGYGKGRLVSKGVGDSSITMDIRAPSGARAGQPFTATGTIRSPSELKQVSFKYDFDNEKSYPVSGHVCDVASLPFRATAKYGGSYAIGVRATNADGAHKSQAVTVEVAGPKKPVPVPFAITLDRPSAVKAGVPFKVTGKLSSPVDLRTLEIRLMKATSSSAATGLVQKSPNVHTITFNAGVVGQRDVSSSNINVVFDEPGEGALSAKLIDTKGQFALGNLPTFTVTGEAGSEGHPSVSLKSPSGVKAGTPFRFSGTAKAPAGLAQVDVLLVEGSAAVQQKSNNLFTAKLNAKPNSFELSSMPGQATFDKAGTRSLRVTVTDAHGRKAESRVSFQVAK